MFLALVFCLSTAFASPDETPHGGGYDDSHAEHARDSGGRQQRAHDPARMMRRFPELAEQLGLSDAQRTAIDQVWYESERAAIDLRASSEKARLELERAAMATSLD
jgi:hypothetical protein